jgi:protein O-GlcNAc transferase
MQGCVAMSEKAIQQSFQTALREYQQGRLVDAQTLCHLILALEPHHADTLHLLGLVVFAEKQNSQAIELIQQAIALSRDNAQYHGSLGLVFFGDGQIADAIAAYQRSLSLEPDSADIHYNLAIAYRADNQILEAMASYRAALAQRPRFPEAMNSLGHLLLKLGRVDEAASAYSAALAMKPEFVEARNNLGVTMKDMGRLDESIACLEIALDYQPDCAAVHSNLIYALHYHPKYDAEMILNAHREWEEKHAKPQAENTYANDPSPDRRLKIGYVSPNFREHCQALFTVPLLSHHDHQAVEVFCYCDAALADTVSKELHGYADHWRDIHGVSDEKFAEMVRADRIDVLVDLTQHMANNRLPFFARHAAPVQVSWLGYPATTGLSAIDYRLTDPHLDPPGSDEFYSEKSFRLPDSFWCYDPRATEPGVNELPAMKNGFVTFGCLNNFCKINNEVLRVWGDVLRAIPDSRLRLLAPPGGSRKEVLDGLKVDPQRVEFLEFRPRSEYLKLYHRIDICLDTFPYNGHTTSLDSFWMGVPVVTLCGQTSVSRAGLSQLSNLNLRELVAHGPAEFVDIAVKLANDLPRLAEIRRSLRERMVASPLMNAARFAKNIENAYRTMWRQWCGKRDITNHNKEVNDVPISIQR